MKFFSSITDILYRKQNKGEKSLYFDHWKLITVIILCIPFQYFSDAIYMGIVLTMMLSNFES